MRRIRNPRYAPEFLERKLSPSGVTGAGSAYVQSTTASGSLYVSYNNTSPTTSELAQGYPTGSTPEPAPTGPVQPA